MKLSKGRIVFCAVLSAFVTAVLVPLLFRVASVPVPGALIALGLWAVLFFASAMVIRIPGVSRILYKSRMMRRLQWNRKLRPYRKESRKLKKAAGSSYCPCCRMYIQNFSGFPYPEYPERYNPARYQNTDTQVICPVCGSMPRHRILVTWMQEHLAEIRHVRVLHFAQEHALRMWMDLHRISYQTADLYADADLKLDLEDTGLPAGSVPMIICNHVLEHVSDYKKALRELSRILAPEGRIIISFPVDPALDMGVLEDPSAVTAEERMQKFGQNDHLRIFGSRAKALLEEHGFLAEEIDGSRMRPEIKPVVGPADYDSNVLYILRKP